MTDQVQNHILNRYQLVKKVGSGAYGHVWKVTDKKSGQKLALKKIFDAFQHSTDAQRTYREIMFLHEFKHENIIKLHNVYRAQNDKDLYLVFEFMQADLHNAIGQKVLKDVHNRFIMYQIIKGIKYLHSALVLHRDLKPSNILLNSDCQVKICDFGLARSLVIDQNNHDVVLTEEVATRWYRAPEVLLGSKSYGAAADVWSIGCILAEVLVGKPFFPGNSTLNQLQKILAFIGHPSQTDITSLDADCASTMIKSITIPRQKQIKQWFKSDTPLQAIDLVVKMLQFNPQKRIKIDDILRHPYMAQFRDKKTQIQSKKVITPPVSDNKKLSLKQYRNLIYQSISVMFNNNNKPTTIEQRPMSVQKRMFSNSIQRQKACRQNRSTDHQTTSSLHYCYSGSQKNFQNNIIQRSSTKALTTNTTTTMMVNSTGKKSMCHSMSHSNFYPTRTSINEEDGLRRKSSLKDLLHRRKSAIKNGKENSSVVLSATGNVTTVPVYQPVYQQQQQSVGNLLQQYKYIKGTQYLAQKENRTPVGKA